MKLKLNNITIPLPKEYDLNQRIELVNDILTNYKDELNYNLDVLRNKNKIDFNSLVEIRLDILGTYILQAYKVNDKSIMTRYKLKYRPLQETSFSQFSESLVEENGLY